MSLKTSLSRTGLGYIFTVANESDPSTELLRFEVQSVSKTAWGISGRVTVRTRMKDARVVPGRANYVTTERIDFLSGRSKQMLADRLASLIPAPPGAAVIDWGILVEELVAGVMDSEHRQPVVKDLSTVTATSHTPHLYPYLLPERKATILYGAGGTGKSAFAAALACVVQVGGTLLGERAHQANVLYLDWETDEGDVANRIAIASRGLGLTAVAPVKYMALELSLEMEMAHIAATVMENEIGFIILDSVGMASSGGRDGSDPADAAIQFFRALRILNATVLCIDHISGEDQRRGRAGAMKPYGSIFKWNSARNAFELIDGGEGKVILRHRKANLGPKMPDGEMVINVTWDQDMAILRYRREATGGPRMSIGERIAEALASGPASYRVLLDVLNADPDYDVASEAELRIATRPMLADGEIVIDYAGVMRLPSPEPEKEPEATGQLAIDEADPS